MGGILVAVARADDILQMLFGTAVRAMHCRIAWNHGIPSVYRAF